MAEILENVNTEATIKIVAYDCETGYAVEDDGNIIPCDKIIDDKGRAVIHLPSNSANRQWADKKRVDEAIASEGGLTLAYKASIKVGSHSTKIPNEALVKTYCTEEEYNEYISIVKKAQEAMQADKKKPLTELEKAQAALAKAQARLAKLTAEQKG